MGQAGSWQWGELESSNLRGGHRTLSPLAPISPLEWLVNQATRNGRGGVIQSGADRDLFLGQLHTVGAELHFCKRDGPFVWKTNRGSLLNGCLQILNGVTPLHRKSQANIQSSLASLQLFMKYCFCANTINQTGESFHPPLN